MLLSNLYSTKSIIRGIKPESARQRDAESPKAPSRGRGQAPLAGFCRGVLWWFKTFGLICKSNHWLNCRDARPGKLRGSQMKVVSVSYSDYLRLKDITPVCSPRLSESVTALTRSAAAFCAIIRIGDQHIIPTGE